MAETKTKTVKVLLSKEVIYFDWAKDLKLIVEDRGITGLFSALDADYTEARLPTLSVQVRTLIAGGWALTESQTKEANQFDKDLQLFTEKCTMALRLIQANVDPAFFEEMKLEVGNRHHLPKLESIGLVLVFFKRECGGIYSGFNDSKNRNAIYALPPFKDAATFRSSIAKLEELMAQRKDWDPVGQEYALDVPFLKIWFDARMITEPMQTFLVTTLVGKTFEECKDMTRKRFKALEESARAKDLFGLSTASASTPSFFSSESSVAFTAGFARKPIKCYNCQKEGHISTNCDQPQRIRGAQQAGSQQLGVGASSGNAGWNRPIFCTICRKEGHWASQCQSSRSTSTSSSSSSAGYRGQGSTQPSAQPGAMAGIKRKFVGVRGSNGQIVKVPVENMAQAQAAMEQFEAQAHATIMMEEEEEEEIIDAPEDFDVSTLVPKVDRA